MTERLPFFLAVDEVLAVLRRHAKRPPVLIQTRSWDERRLESAESLTPASADWELLITELLPHDRAVLEYVARLCQARDALVSRRVATVLGGCGKLLG